MRPCALGVRVRACACVRVCVLGVYNVCKYISIFFPDLILYTAWILKCSTASTPFVCTVSTNTLGAGTQISSKRTMCQYIETCVWKAASHPKNKKKNVHKQQLTIYIYIYIYMHIYSASLQVHRLWQLWLMDLQALTQRDSESLSDLRTNSLQNCTKLTTRQSKSS